MISKKNYSKKHKVLITGGAGFIGSFLSDLFIENQHEVCVLDNLSYGKRHFLPDESDTFQFVQGDILNTNLLFEVFKNFQPTLLYHLAAIHHIPTCESDPSKALGVNIEGTQAVLLAVTEVPSIQRIVFASSGAVYDTLDIPLTEDSPIVPHDIYGISKVSGEHLMRINAKKNNLETVIGRIFNAIGARETNEHLVPDILRQVVRGERRIKLGNLEPRRSYSHVKDVANGLYVLGWIKLKVKHEIFNIGSEQEYSVLDILQLLSEIIGNQLTPERTREKIRKIDRLSQQAVISKIRQQSDWQPERTLKEALREALEDFE